MPRFRNKKRKQAMVILALRLHSGKEVDSMMKNEESMRDMEALHAVAEEIIGAIDSKSPADLAQALHNFFVICESTPHEEEGYACGGMVKGKY